jgi:hypothetical protein
MIFIKKNLVDKSDAHRSARIDTEYLNGWNGGNGTDTE